MVLEQDILPYLQWFLGGADSLGALPRFLLIVLGIGLLGLVGGYVMAAARHGVLRGGDITYRTVSAGFRELFEMSPRRIWALARLAMKEAWRRRVWVALAIFVIILMFAGWFLKTDHQDPAKLYISFVLTATTYLVLGIALLLSAFSLPGDFKSKTIYTIVTKPVRSGEIVLGRILGFTLIGTFLLVTMAVCSYVFVTRSLGHTHVVERSSVKLLPGGEGASEGQTSLESYHRHFVHLDADHRGEAESNHGHFHYVEPRGEDFRVLPAEGFMRARVPRWGSLAYLDRQGVSKERGISVGSEWTYRSFIEGSSQAAAIWTFDNIAPPKPGENSSDSDEEEGLPIGLIVRVFRTHKGVIGKPITGAIQVRNPDTGLSSDLIPFGALDAKVDERIISRKLTSTEGAKIDLYDDIVSNGRLQIVVQCLEKGQYFGFAKPDCYLRLPDGSPVLNFIKVYLSIWVQMVIVIAIGVAASTLLSGPVALLLTVSFILLGFFREFFVGVATGTEYGGGPIESLVRLVTQQNVMSPLKAGGVEPAIQGVDGVLKFLMQSLAQVLPDFSSFSTVDFAAYGYDVPADRVFQDLTTCLAYIVGLAVIGYFLLRTREVAK
ncbi:MAG: ABC transporter permease [Planctomycetes bacterium]|nr:ABC transporter permease [Planctomycetota bacterium]